MTEQETIDLLRFTFPKEITKPVTEEAISKAVKSLEKQIPIEPIFVHPLYEGDDCNFVCPICKTGPLVKRIDKFCWGCGQAIKWYKDSK